MANEEFEEWLRSAFGKDGLNEKTKEEFRASVKNPNINHHVTKIQKYLNDIGVNDQMLPLIMPIKKLTIEYSEKFGFSQNMQSLLQTHLQKTGSFFNADSSHK